MGESEGANADMMQRLQSSFGTSSSSFLKQTLSMDQLTIPQFTPSQQMRAATTTRTPHHSYGGDGNRRAGIPPSHPHQIPPISPYSQIPPSSSSSSSRTLHHQAGSPTPTHTRSLSQPSFFSLDSLPPLSPSPFRDSSTSISDSADVSMEDRDVTSHHSLLPPSSPFSAAAAAARGGSNNNLPPPRKSHRRSSSDIPFGFSNVINSSPPLIPLRGAPNASQMIKKEDAEGSGEKKFSPEGEVVDDLFSAYMNLDNINDALNNNNSSDEKNGTENNDLDSRASGTKTNNTGGGGGGDSSDNEAESSVNEQEGGGVKRSAVGDVVAVAAAAATSSGSRHYRSVSMDSFIGKLSFSDHESLLSLPPSKMMMMPPSSPGSSRPAGGGGGLVSSPSSNGVDGNSSGFSLEFGNGEFSGPELKKIMANEKLAEIAVSDPKRAKRILANRQSAARSKERKMRYISELEHKVQTLQTEATTLSAQLTLLQRDSVGLTNQNSELKFRLQSMEQQAKLRDALNEALTAEVQRLKLATAELNGESHPSSCLIPQHSVNPLMFQQQPPTASQQNIRLQQRQQLQHQPQQQNGNANSQTDLKQ